MTARIVIAGTSSGAGKTTVASGLMAAFRARGRTVQGAKVGPDFIDPSYHALATGRPARNLDAFLAGPELVAPLLAHGIADHADDGRPADLTVIEGVMGLFDGASGRGELASTAHVAKLTRSPVVLVVDAAAMARSVAALVLGFRNYDLAVDVAGVILNRVGSSFHADLLREALEPIGVPVLGALTRDDRLVAPSRHLGLVPVEERDARARETLDVLAARVAAEVDLDALERLAGAAPALGPAWDPTQALARAAGEPGRTPATGPGATPAAAGGLVAVPPPPDRRPRIAYAAGAAFTFRYTENLELLRAAGAELVPVDPLRDAELPEATDALYLGGGFPEEHGEALAANAPLRAAVAGLAAAGRPIVAECGGLLYLGGTLDGRPMCGVLEGTGALGTRLTLGYREAEAGADSPLWRAGEVVRGHEFHYSTLTPEATSPPAWTLRSRGRERPEGVATGTLHASYLHTHWAAFPQAAARLVAAASA
ncbi:cobyrinate a,c-diamide synthase [Patulibacter brassicae]|uniref:Hydrogenobyrinate a,c-diamide synthase n=1 Tax=Patulibacter brassicae TaxID=1705717 RepID=A0ABU4VKF6_9ACTN|nr:cobyrinate a,c-diamide synthase [Patulibacter brassicae]MDX8151564.1 cobyrinate a,c-diamide synthase [Patulibacter brassicae]